MTYQVLYGEAPARLHLDERVCSERFSTEHEALRRARELLDQDSSLAIAIRYHAGQQLSGIPLQLRLRLGYSSIE